MSVNKVLKCHYCSTPAKGINYRPRPELQNAPACQKHKTSLFIPYRQQIKTDLDNVQQSSDTVSELLTVQTKNRQQKNQQFFEDLMKIVVGQFNQFKSQVQSCQEKIKKLDKNQTTQFNLNSKLTNPYMILKQDRQMMLNTFLSRIKHKFDQNNGKKSKNLQENKSQCSGSKSARQSTPLSNLKVSTMTDVSNNYRASFDTPITKEEVMFLRKSQRGDI